ncbi:MAG: S8 family serine peptidase [candidate division Zixibacteria bacterium]
MKITVIYSSQIILMLILLGSVTGAANDSDISYQPGKVLILTDNGFRPTLNTLFSKVSATDAGFYQGWTLRSLAESYSTKYFGKKAASETFLADLYILDFPDTIDVMDVIGNIQKSPGVRLVEPDYKMELFDWPSDSLFEYQWYYHNSGQEYYGVIRHEGENNDTLYLATGLAGEDIKLSTVYDNVPADAVEVIVAILDTGVDYGHPDLQGNIFFNQDDIPGNDIDDDHNGLVDDYVGWDFSGNSLSVFGAIGDSDPSDNVGHGTHIAGLIAAKWNQTGISGFPGNIKILPVKIFPRAFQSVTVPAIIYAVEMGARVMNLSWGSPYEMGILHEAIKYAHSRGCILVAAAGNFGNSITVVPAGFDETFTVGGTNSHGYVTYFSSYGPSLDIVAPGRDILSLRARNTDLYEDEEPGLRIIAEDYILADGTSMSAPLVAGAAAMLWSFNPSLDAAAIEQTLRETADDILDPFNTGDNLPGYDTLSGWGRLNVGTAFQSLNGPTVYLTNPGNAEIVRGDIPIGIAVTGDYSGFARLYVGEGKFPEEWTLLKETSTATDDSQFFIWDSDGLVGYYTFRLDSEAGNHEITCRLINAGGAYLSSPINGEEYKYLISIHGSAFGQEYDSVVASYHAADASEYSKIFSSPQMYFDEFVVDWPIFSLETGSYILKIESHCGAQVYSDLAEINIVNTMRSGFPKAHPGFMAFSPGTSDIDGDGKKEIVVGTDHGVYAYNDDGSILPGFPVDTDKDMRAIPSFDDIDGDGLTDIIISGKSILACYNYMGQSLSGWPRQASTGMTYYTYPVVTATELFDYSDSVALYMSPYGEVRAYKFDGTSYFYSLDGLFTALDPNIFDTLTNSGLSAPFVTATDLENDNTIDVVAIYGTTIDESGVYVWNGRNGLALPGWESPQARNIRLTGGGVLADLDENGTLEIIVAGEDASGANGIWALENGKEDLPGWPVFLPAIDDWISTVPVSVDFDGDGRKEVIIAYYNWDFAHVYAFNHDGSPCKDNPSYLPRGLLLTVQNTLGHIIIADLDGNGTQNIISRAGHLFPYTASYEKIYVWEPDGTPTPGFPIITPTPASRVYSTPNTPVVDDLDGDGTTEIILCGDANELFVWNLGTPYIPENMLWPKFLGDDKNTGVNPHRGTPTAIDESNSHIPLTFEITSNYPNPFNPETTVQFTLDRGGDIKLDIYNILGQHVNRLADGYYPAGSHQVVWSGTDNTGKPVASGIYLVRLSDTKRISTHKMILMK